MGIGGAGAGTRQFIRNFLQCLHSMGVTEGKPGVGRPQAKSVAHAEPPKSPGLDYAAVLDAAVKACLEVPVIARAGNKENGSRLQQLDLLH